MKYTKDEIAEIDRVAKETSQAIMEHFPKDADFEIEMTTETTNSENGNLLLRVDANTFEISIGENSFNFMKKASLSDSTMSTKQQEITETVLNTITNCKEFYRFDREESDFNCSVALGASPTSNKETVIEYWKSQGKNIEIIDDLAAYSNVNPSIVIKDLNKAVKMKLIPQGHFGRDNMIFIVSNEIYDEYKNKQAVYDRYYRKQIEERLRMKERTKEMQMIMDQGQGYVDKIHESNDIIKDKIISQKLDRMESVVSMIFHEVDVNPNNADKLGMFMNYYLPTTEKLLEAYIDIDEKKVKGKSLEKTKKDFENRIKKLETKSLKISIPFLRVKF